MELLEEVHRAVWVELTSQVYVDEDTLATVQRTAVETTSDAGTRVFHVTSDRGGIATVRVEDGTVHCTCSVFKEAVVCGHIFATLLEHFDVNQVTFSEGPSAAADIIIHRIRSTRWLGEDTRAAASLAHQIALPAPVANPPAPAASAAPAAPAGPGGVAAPAARGAPGGAAAPAAPAGPGGAAAPAARGAPGGAAAPAARGAPGGAAAPAARGAPGGVAAPAAHGAPGGAPAPAARGAPGSAAAPAARGAPGGAAAPAARGAPGGAAAPAARGAPGGAAAPAARGMLKNKRGVPRPTDALDAVGQVPQQVVAAIGGAPAHMHPAVEEPRIYHAAPGRRSSKSKSWAQLGEEGRQLPYWMR